MIEKIIIDETSEENIKCHQNLKTDNLKSIYCITNLINNKKYIGQSKNPDRRFKAHLRSKDNLPIHRAIMKYGAENFELTILERDVDKYNTQECYWINKLNTMVPNGYNATCGGEGYPHWAGTEMYNSTLFPEDVEQIYDELLNPKLTIYDIAKLHNVRRGVIYSINYGTTYARDHCVYPIRDKDFLNKYVLELLLSNQYTIDEIDNLVCYSKHTIKSINNGSKYKQPNISYPILDLNHHTLKDESIRTNVKLLLETQPNISISQIAKMYNTTKFAINAFNQGNSYHNASWDYPLRKDDFRTRFFSEEEKDDIVKMLLDTHYSKKDILDKYKLDKRVLDKFNNGDNGYRIDNVNYPIRLPRKKLNKNEGRNEYES